MKILTLTLSISAAAAGPALAETSAAGESKPHEFACMAATIGGTVAGIAVGSLLGGGIGTLMFEGAGGEIGGKAGQMLKCPGK